MKLKSVNLTILCLLISAAGYSQNIVKGKITDEHMYFLFLLVFGIPYLNSKLSKATASNAIEIEVESPKPNFAELNETPSIESKP